MSGTIIKLSHPTEQDHPRHSWRNTLREHPACKLFPPMAPDELRALGKDIRKNGLLSPIILWTADKHSDDEPVWLLDGRNRLDALEVTLGRPVRVVGRVHPRSRARDHMKVWTIETDDENSKPRPISDFISVGLSNLFCEHAVVLGANEEVDPYKYVISTNIRRRHLTDEQKRTVIAQLLKATPEKSDRQIAEMVKASPTTVGKVRTEGQLSSHGQLKRVGKDGKARKQPTKKAERPKAQPADYSKPTLDLLRAVRALAERDERLGLTDESDKGAQQEVGPQSPGEVARLQVRVDELENEKRRLELSNIALQSEVEELKAEIERLKTAAANPMPHINCGILP
jgi:FtsZ-binding cell division protein ZapB